MYNPDNKYKDPIIDVTLLSVGESSNNSSVSWHSGDTEEGDY